MTRLIMVRHGETYWHAENRYTGASDVRLTEAGVGQAAVLAQWVAANPVSRVLSSPLRRAYDTAQPSARALGLDVTVETRLSEVDFGAGEGLTRAEMARKFPEALDAFLAAPGRNPLPGGERGVDAVARAWPVIEELRYVDAAGPVLVVAHATLLRLLLCRMLGLPLDDYRRRFPSLRNCATTTVELSETGTALLSLNAGP